VNEPAIACSYLAERTNANDVLAVVADAAVVSILRRSKITPYVDVTLTDTPDVTVEAAAFRSNHEPNVELHACNMKYTAAVEPLVNSTWPTARPGSKIAVPYDEPAAVDPGAIVIVCGCK